MSENIRGITFAEQTVTPADDAIVRRAMLSDGILSGCNITYSGSTLTMAGGYVIACGRSFQITAAQNWAVVDATSGVARLVLTIDMTKTATETTFNQISFSIEYASNENGFVELTQDDINIAGVRYQVAVAVVSLGAGGITGILSKLEKAEGGGGLNFKVVAGLTQPGSATDNTIWVNVEKMTGWIFSATEPEDPEDGLVWIVTGQASTVAFNALKKNNLQVYPLSAKQYRVNAWADIVAQSCQGGLWVDWIVYLYNRGDECVDLTGGWVGKGMKASSTSEAAAAEPIITRNDDHILAKLPAAQKSGVFWTHELVDLTTCSKITVEGEFYAVSTNFALTIWSSNEGTYYTQNNAAESKFPAKEVFNKLSVDVSALTGEYCIGFKLNTNGDTSNQSYIKLVQSHME